MQTNLVTYREVCRKETLSFLGTYSFRCGVFLLHYETVVKVRAGARGAQPPYYHLSPCNSMSPQALVITIIYNSYSYKITL